MKRIMVSMLLVMTLSLGLISCGTNSSSDSSDTSTAKTNNESNDSGTNDEDLTDMSLSFSTWVGSGMFYIAQEKGFFAENGLNVDINIVDDESTFASLMATNSIQALGHVLDREVINYSNGVNEKVIMAYDQSSGGDGIVASKEIQSPEDLAGKTVALDKSSTSYFYFLTVLDKAGLTEDDVTIRDMDADSAGTSFVQGQIDAAVTWEPWLSNASQRQGGHLLCDSGDYPNTIVDVVTFTDTFMKEHPEAAPGFVKAWNEAVDWYYDGNENDGNKIMADALGIDLDDFESQVSGVTWYDRDTMNTFFDESTENNIYEVGDRAIKFWVERGLIDSSFTSSDLITKDYLDLE